MSVTYLPFPSSFGSFVISNATHPTGLSNGTWRTSWRSRRLVPARIAITSGVYESSFFWSRQITTFYEQIVGIVKLEIESGTYLHGDAFRKLEGDWVRLVTFGAMLVRVKMTFYENSKTNVLPECLWVVIPQTVKAESIFPRRYRPAC